MRTERNSEHSSSLSQPVSLASSLSKLQAAPIHNDSFDENSISLGVQVLKEVTDSSFPVSRERNLMSSTTPIFQIGLT